MDIRDLEAKNRELTARVEQLVHENMVLLSQVTLLQTQGFRELAKTYVVVQPPSNPAVERLTYFPLLAGAGLGNLVREEVALSKATTLPFPITR